MLRLNPKEVLIKHPRSFFLIMTILVVFSLFAQDGSAEPVQDTTPLPFTKLAPRLYKIDVDGTAVLASIGPDGVLLSDSGEESTAPRLLATLDSLGAQKIDMIVNSHWHEFSNRRRNSADHKHQHRNM